MYTFIMKTKKIFGVLFILLILSVVIMFIGDKPVKAENMTIDQVMCVQKVYSFYYALEPDEKNNWNNLQKHLFVKLHESKVREICGVK